MVEPSLRLTFTLTSFVLIALTRPNIALILANSIGQGTGAGSLLVVGHASAGALLQAFSAPSDRWLNDTLVNVAPAAAAGRVGRARGPCLASA